MRLAQVLAMSLKSATEKIDGILNAAVLAFCVCVWAAFGFPAFIAVAVVATCVILVIAGAFWLTKSRQKSRSS